MPGPTTVRGEPKATGLDQKSKSKPNSVNRTSKRLRSMRTSQTRRRGEALADKSANHRASANANASSQPGQSHAPKKFERLRRFIVQPSNQIIRTLCRDLLPGGDVFLLLAGGQNQGTRESTFGPNVLSASTHQTPTTFVGAYIQTRLPATTFVGAYIQTRLPGFVPDAYETFPKLMYHTSRAIQTFSGVSPCPLNPNGSVRIFHLCKIPIRFFSTIPAARR